MRCEEWDCDLIVGYGHITNSGNNFNAHGRNGLGTILKNAKKKPLQPPKGVLGSESRTWGWLVSPAKGDEKK